MDKLPPQNLEAERSTLGAMLLDNQGLADVRAILRAEDFYQTAHREIFRAVCELAAEAEPVDSITLTDKLVAAGKLEKIGGVAYITGLTDATPTSAHAVYHARIVKDHATRRAIIRQAVELQADAWADAADPGQIIETARQTLAELSRQSLAAIVGQPQSLADSLADFMQAVADPPLGYQSGFTHLDNLLHDLRPGVFVIAAPPSAGKTTFVNQIAGQVCENGATALFFSYEQSAGELLAKSIARHFKISNEAFYADEQTRKGSVLDKLQGVKLDTWKAGAGRLKVIEADARHTVDIIRRLAEQEKAATGDAPIIAIDYLQILPDPRKHASTRDKVDALVSDLRRIARDLGAPVIAISSMARDQYKEIALSGFKESGGIEYGADVAAILATESETPQKRDAALAVLKNRNGRREKIFFTYDLIHDTFTETDRNPQAIDYRASLGAKNEQDYEDGRHPLT